MKTNVERELRDAIDAIIEGVSVERSKHVLMYEGVDVSALFTDRLLTHGYHPSTVDDVQVKPGERVPAFYLKDQRAFFGWIFWEQFTSWKLRKLWGSVVKNHRGDWEIQFPPSSSARLYANESLKLEMDIDHPSEF